MPIAALNVRPSRQRSLEVVRVDKRNRDVALQSIGVEVLLYAPSDEPQHGYFGTARIADISPDVRQPRFIFIALDRLNLFDHFIALETLAEPLEGRAYRADGSIDFSYFSLGIRALSPLDQAAVVRLTSVVGSKTEAGYTTAGFEMASNP